MLKIGKILSIATVATLCSCSVLEERDGCPCVLTVFADKETAWCYTAPPSGALLTQKISYPLRLYVTVGKHIAYDNDTAFSDNQNEETINLTKGKALLTYHTTLDKLQRMENCLSVEKGEQWDRLFIGSDEIDCAGETADIALNFRKEHCIIWIEFVGEPPGEECPFTLAINGNTSGINLITGKPLPGSFQCIPTQMGPFTFEAVVSRQIDDSLTLNLTDENGLVRICEIGEYIRKEGFDWNKRDLDNITLKIGYGTPQISIDIVPWTEVPTPVPTL